MCWLTVTLSWITGIQSRATKALVVTSLLFQFKIKKKRPTVSAFQHCNIYLGCKKVALNFHTEGGFVTGTDSNV